MMSALSGCGLLPANPEVDPEFRIIYSEFLMDAARYGAEPSLGNLVVRFSAPGQLGPDTAGICISKEVMIDPDYWQVCQGYCRELLIYHELGHCTLGQSHRVNSIMSATLLRTYTYQANREAYVRELMTYGASEAKRPDYEHPDCEMVTQ
jgi:hypothetical protein